MPRNLPGFYFDDEKQRYFPISSKPTSKPIVIKPDPPNNSIESPNNKPSPSSQQNLKRKWESISSNSMDNMRRSINPTQNQQFMHQITCSKIASTSRMTRVPLIPYATHLSVTSFKLAVVNGRVKMYYGDTSGWLYSFNEHKDADSYDPTTLDFPIGFWVPELNLASEISSICISDSKCIATSFGPSCKIFVQDLVSADTFILNHGRSYLHDVWTSHLLGRKLALGANKKALFIQDVDSARSIHILDTQSDVFAVEQQENLVYTGARNGSILRFDTRLDHSKSQRLLDEMFGQPSSVTHLNIVQEWQLLVGNRNGSLGTYDLRFARGNSPLMTFAGHTNSYITKLALAIDPSEDFVFAAGQDRRIRAWSLRSGEALLPPSQFNTVRHGTNPFDMEFSQPVVTMQITEESEGMCLWAAADKDIFRFHLGQH